MSVSRGADEPAKLGGIEGLRRRVLAECGASEATMDELLAYTDNPYRGEEPAASELPLADEPHVERWLLYQEEASGIGAFAALRKRFVQLRFPIRPGISDEEPYRRATLKGEFEAAESVPGRLELECPDDLELSVRPTIGGRIPVLVVPSRNDFVSLVRAFGARNEPVAIPDSMGASIVGGLNNWDRVRAYRRRWEDSRDGPVSEAAWQQEFRRLVPRKHLYQDRLVILSTGPYSAVEADDVGMAEEQWLARSLEIRREHEFTHYFTYRTFGSIRSNAFDELLADFVGLVRSFGRYRADLALLFLGLESHPDYRAGGRLEDYRGDPPLSGEAFEVLQRLVARSAENLDSLDRRRDGDAGDLSRLAATTLALAGLAFEELAAEDMVERVIAKLDAA